MIAFSRVACDARRAQLDVDHATRSRARRARVDSLARRAARATRLNGSSAISSIVAIDAGSGTGTTRASAGAGADVDTFVVIRYIDPLSDSTYIPPGPARMSVTVPNPLPNTIEL